MNCDDVAEAYVDVVAAEDEADAQEACDNCPTGVITIK
jgi:ferredoxin